MGWKEVARVENKANSKAWLHYRGPYPKAIYSLKKVLLINSRHRSPFKHYFHLNLKCIIYDMFGI